MNKFLFKSTAADLSKILPILETLQKNMLYLTYRIDAVLKKVTALEVDNGLQRQVDEYFEEGARTGLEDTRTSPQTEPDGTNTEGID